MSERSSAEGNQRPSGGKSTLHKKGEGGERSYRPSCQGGKLSFLGAGWHVARGKTNNNNMKRKRGEGVKDHTDCLAKEGS